MPFNIRPGKEGSIEAAEEFFIDSLEEWRKAEGIDKMILFGHSLGGYLSACYSMKYPERVEHLLMVSPVGVPMPPPPGSDQFPTRRRANSVLMSTVRFFWERSYTPQGLIRFAGPFGPSLVKWYTDRRFDLEGEEANLIRNYAYHYSARPSSAESGMHCLLDVGAWGRKPLVNRVHAIRSPTTWLYGSVDWMDPNGGWAASAKMTTFSRVLIIPDAGHHLYIDNTERFNEAVLEIIENIQGTASAGYGASNAGRSATATGTTGTTG